MDGALSSDPSIPQPVETIDDASQKTSLGWSGLRKHTVTPFVLRSEGGKSTVCLAGPRVYRSCPATVVGNSVPALLQYLYWVV